MAPGYLAHLEEGPADPTSATLNRPADALGTSVAGQQLFEAAHTVLVIDVCDHRR
ncbi:hypothetical protein FB563_8037 [Streptomyces puniciscabiei]|uniref:Uncharacterized protein n=2 Tax=Streptomyces puniciscabiei TaxID=164348 RepID=A0A542SYS4_9ACTN|nr:hypothetical protein FB563_8037 [Streptomyces puniciscabiei]